jgi:hypothetical protein
MTMKTLLLGAAAGLVTVGAAQAADLPMTKAEAVEYVKVCTEFGEGFFYIPGTDTCLKISGEVRADIRFQDRDNRQTDVVFFKTEPRLKFDARTNTEYGILRSYIQMNMPIQAEVQGFQLDKAFIQFGGLTAGYAHTFFGIYDADYGNTIFAPYFSSQSTVNLLAYTAVFGGGFSATLSVEDGRDHRTFLTGFDPITPQVISPLPYGGQSMPDFVGQLRADGAWGEAAVFGAVHQIRYPAGAVIAAAAPVALPGGVAVVSPDADYGWAVGAGVGWNLPFLAGSHIALEATYADGANNYLGFGQEPDSLFTFFAPTDTDQGHGWSITGEFGVNVSPVLNVTAFGSYLDYSGGSVSGVVGGAPVTLDEGDFKDWVAGINATYTIVPGLVVQPEIFYQKRETILVGDDESHIAGGVRLKRTF